MKKIESCCPLYKIKKEMKNPIYQIINTIKIESTIRTGRNPRKWKEKNSGDWEIDEK